MILRKGRLRMISIGDCERVVVVMCRRQANSSSEQANNKSISPVKLSEHCSSQLSLCFTVKRNFVPLPIIRRTLLAIFRHARNNSIIRVSTRSHRLWLSLLSNLTNLPFVPFLEAFAAVHAVKVREVFSAHVECLSKRCGWSLCARVHLWRRKSVINDKSDKR